MSGETQAMQVLRLLQKAGDRGVTNKQLADISLQYNARVHTLRHRWGHDIRKRRVYYGTRATETYIYYLVPKQRPVASVVAKATPADLPENKPVVDPKLLDVEQVKRERQFF